MGKAHAHDVGQVASDVGVMVRAGHHCAQPLMEMLGEAATVRASFYIYNTEEEAGRLAKAVKRASELLG
ncbi:MAG: aminotransferase class V-fold PLP-dependent enzyme [Candidatus Micrarchaeota archaeon]|nr:aminotransferase class V-fold PLP-dependent enzyme [Candidatus Micrarchaeota archaeon]